MSVLCPFSLHFILYVVQGWFKASYFEQGVILACPSFARYHTFLACVGGDKDDASCPPFHLQWPSKQRWGQQACWWEGPGSLNWSPGARIAWEWQGYLIKYKGEDIVQRLYAWLGGGGVSIVIGMRNWNLYFFLFLVTIKSSKNVLTQHLSVFRRYINIANFLWCLKL